MNQPPPTEKQTSKRIVSKGEYAANVGYKASASVFGVGLLGLGSIGMLVAVFYGMPGLILGFIRGDWQDSAGFVLTIGVASAAFLWSGWSALTEANQVEAVVPFTRANTADLPAPDTLVRASAEPVQEPQAVLLRAATDTQERHEEQLVRASVGGTEQA